jgi:hypothetical protein
MKIIIPPGTCIDPILKANRRPDTDFILEAGRYTTQGCFAFPEYDLCMLAGGQTLSGAGKNKTFLMLDNPVLRHEGKPTGYTEVITGGSRTAKEDGDCVEISGLDVFCPTHHHQSSLIPVIGIHLWSSHAKVSNVSVTGVWGDRSLPVPNEGFGIIINNPYQVWGGAGGNIIEDCFVELRPGAYACGVYMGILDGNPRSNVQSRIDRTDVTGQDCHAGFGVNCNTVITECSVEGVDRAIFCDTQVLVGDMSARDIKWALDLRAYKNETAIQDILFQGGFFLFRNESPDMWAQAVLLEDNRTKPAGGRIENVRFVGTTFRSGNTKASKGRITGHTDKPVFVACEWVGQGQWEEVVDQSIS